MEGVALTEREKEEVGRHEIERDERIDEGEERMADIFQGTYADGTYGPGHGRVGVSPSRRMSSTYHYRYTTRGMWTSHVFCFLAI